MLENAIKERQKVENSHREIEISVAILKKIGQEPTNNNKFWAKEILRGRKVLSWNKSKRVEKNLQSEDIKCWKRKKSKWKLVKKFEELKRRQLKFNKELLKTKGENFKSMKEVFLKWKQLTKFEEVWID